jgi:hypothetical protein
MDVSRSDNLAGPIFCFYRSFTYSDLYLFLHFFKFRVTFPIVIGIFVGLAAAVSITLIYIPSAVATVIQFRTGNIASLKSTHFPRLRTGLEQTTLLFGTIFWGALFTASMMALIVGFVLFFVCWQVCEVVFGIVDDNTYLILTNSFTFDYICAHKVTRPLALNICASVIGMCLYVYNGQKTVCKKKYCKRYDSLICIDLHSQVSA